MTRAELDEAVLAVSEKLADLFDDTRMHSCCSDKEFRLFGAFREAVRARRAAMRPHKAALLWALLKYGDPCLTDHDYWRLRASEWNGCIGDRSSLHRTVSSKTTQVSDTRWREKVHEALAEIIAAPDEEQP